MQLTEQEKSKAWWGGAISGVLSAVPQGLVIGLAASAFLFFAVVPAAAALGISLAPVFGLFIATSAGAFTPLPMMMFNVAILGISNAISGGASAVKDYHQQKHNAMYESRIHTLESRSPTQAHGVEAPERSATVQRILDQSPRPVQTHAEAETTRRTHRVTTRVFD